MLGQLVSNLHGILQGYPDLDIKPFLSELKPQKLKYVMRELDRLNQRQENSFVQDSAQKPDTSFRNSEREQRTSLNQSFRNSATQLQTQEMMKRLHGMKDIFR